MNEEQMRVDFETFLASEMVSFSPELLFERRGDGEYVSLVAHYAWKSWQAAVASQAKSEPDGYVLVPIKPTDEMCKKGAAHTP